MEEKILAKLEKVWIDSVKKCLGKRKKVAVVFSGGIDSSLVAFTAQRLGVKVVTFTVGFEKSADFEFIRDQRQKLPFETRLVKVSKEEVKETLKKVRQILKEAGVKINPMQYSLGVSLFLVLKEMKREGFSFTLSGQGADEIFAGYFKHTLMPLEKVNPACKKGGEEMEKNDLERERAVGNYLDISISYPFLESQLVKLALEIPAELKLKGKGKSLVRKYILRELGKKMELPWKIVNRPKKAFQYSSGIHKEVMKISKWRNLKRRA